MRHVASVLISGILLCIGSAAFGAETIRIAHIDPISGPFGNVGESLGRHLQAVAGDINAKGGAYGGAKFELINHRQQEQPARQRARAAAGHRRRHPLCHPGQRLEHRPRAHRSGGQVQRRNPDKPVVYLNFGAIDPALTNEKCNYWHFRFDANVDMKIEALTNYMAMQKGIQKLYLINQDYAFGQSVSRVGKEMLGAKRPDVKIVGDDLHPVGKVKDFSPYIAKIKASDADTVLTGNWGNDLSLLVKAGKDAGLW